MRTVITEMHRFVFSLLLCICMVYSVFAQDCLLWGTVSLDGQKYPGVSVGVVGTSIGTFTDEHGSYSIRLNPGTYSVEYSFVGYESRIERITIYTNVKKNVTLHQSYIELRKVVVTSDAADRNVSSSEVGTQYLQRQELKLTPVLFGENDVLKTIQLMPGVKSAGEGGGGFVVRGGGTDQNLLLIDGAPVYNASHMLGMFSIFNGDAVEQAKLYKGSMPASLGGRLSSVLEISSVDGSLEDYHATGGIGLISSRLEVDGPLKKGKSSFLVAARRTYVDLFLKLARDTAIRDTKLNFYDLNCKFVNLINDKHKISFSGYFGRDVFKFRKMFGTEGGNATATLRLRSLLGSKTTLNSYLIYSNFTSDIQLNTEIVDAHLETGLSNLNWKEDFSSRWGATTLSYGGNVGFYWFSPGRLTTGMLDKPVHLSRRYASDASLYVSAQQDCGSRVKLEYGLRFSNFFVFGPATTYTYNEEHEITDSVVYRRGEIVNYFPHVEPRLNVNVRLSGESSLKLALTRTTQDVHLIQSSTLNMPTDYWMPSFNKTEPQVCSQISLGYFRNFKENMFESSVEVYYKDMRNQLDYENGTNLFLNENLEAYLLYGRSYSYGLELYLKKNVGNLTGWISYTLSKTEKKCEGINNGNWFPVRFDRTHDLSIVAMYDISERFHVSATWVYSTGDAVTFPVGKYWVDGEEVSYYTERNGFRMPAYHRMDAGMTYTFKKKKRVESELAVSVYNLYNRKNAYMIYFESVDEENPHELQAIKVTLFPLIPSVSWNFRF